MLSLTRPPSSFMCLTIDNVHFSLVRIDRNVGVPSLAGPSGLHRTAGKADDLAVRVEHRSSGHAGVDRGIGDYTRWTTQTRRTALWLLLEDLANAEAT